MYSVQWYILWWDRVDNNNNKEGYIIVDISKIIIMCLYIYIC